MYETGGKLNLLGWITVVVVAIGTTVGLIAELGRAQGVGRAVGILASTVFWGGIAYKIFNRKK